MPHAPSARVPRTVTQIRPASRNRDLRLRRTAASRALHRFHRSSLGTKLYRCLPCPLTPILWLPILRLQPIVFVRPQRSFACVTLIHAWRTLSDILACNAISLVDQCARCVTPAALPKPLAAAAPASARAVYGSPARCDACRRRAIRRGRAGVVPRLGHERRQDSVLQRWASHAEDWREAAHHGAYAEF